MCWLTSVDRAVQSTLGKTAAVEGTLHLPGGWFYSSKNFHQVTGTGLWPRACFHVTKDSWSCFSYGWRFWIKLSWGFLSGWQAKTTTNYFIKSFSLLNVGTLHFFSESYRHLRTTQSFTPLYFYIFMPPTSAPNAIDLHLCQSSARQCCPCLRYGPLRNFSLNYISVLMCSTNSNCS